MSTGGLFEPGESKKANAVREVEEEVGLTQEFCLDGRVYMPCLTDAGYLKY